MRITKVDTQGRHDADQWVTRYLLSSSLDGIHWQIYRFNSQDKVCEKISFPTLQFLITHPPPPPQQKKKFL